MKIENTEIKIIKGDITDLTVDAIVSVANDRLLMNVDVASAIKRKGGQAIEDEAVKNLPVVMGNCVLTTAGNLKAKHVIHSVIMGMDLRTDEKKIRQGVAGALKLANQMKLKSLAFPALGHGVGGFPLIGVPKVMIQEVLKFLRQAKSAPSEIIFCLYDDDSFKIFEKTIPAYLEHVLYTLSKGPFLTVDIIIELKEGIVVIERSNPPLGLALPGGFVDYGESLEEAACREAKEETNLKLLNLKQFHTFSEPGRDPRFHTVSTVFIAGASGIPKSGDDAKALRVVPLKDLMKLDYAFDHKQVIKDYLKQCGMSSAKSKK
ncbi:MAG: macro domain-containing protein [Candidatus Omnitrophota bacterium]